MIEITEIEDQKAVKIYSNYFAYVIGDETFKDFEAWAFYYSKERNEVYFGTSPAELIGYLSAQAVSLDGKFYLRNTKKHRKGDPKRDASRFLAKHLPEPPKELERQLILLSQQDLDRTKVLLNNQQKDL